MTLTQLEAFVLVARLGSVKAAAAALGVSEPAVSSALAALRQHLGDPLVSRTAARDGAVRGRAARGRDRLADGQPRGRRARRDPPRARCTRAAAGDRDELGRRVRRPAAARRVHGPHPGRRGERRGGGKPPRCRSCCRTGSPTSRSGPRLSGVDSVPMMRHKLVVVAAARTRWPAPAGSRPDRWRAPTGWSSRTAPTRERRRTAAHPVRGARRAGAGVQRRGGRVVGGRRGARGRTRPRDPRRAGRRRGAPRRAARGRHAGGRPLVRERARTGPSVARR